MTIRTAMQSAVWGALMVSCAAESPPRADGEGPVVSVRIVTATREPIPLTATAVGTTEPFARATTATRLMGRVAEVTVQEGDPVHKGQVLVRVDHGDLSARERQAQSGLEEARAVLASAEVSAGRMRNLYREKAVAKARLDDAETALARARAAETAAEGGLQEVRAHLGYSDVRSPLDGVVARKLVQPGDMAAPGAPLMTVEQQDPMKVVVKVSEGDLGLARVGETVPVEVGSGGEWKSRDGKVDAVVPSADAASRTFDVKVLIDNAGDAVRSGVYARVHFSKGDRPGVLVPETAVTKAGQLEGVFVVVDGRARLRWVRFGRTLGGRREVISGVEPGEAVVAVSEGIRDGVRVE